MEIGNAAKQTARILRTSAVTDGLPVPEAQRLERLFESGPSFRKFNLNPKHAEINVINGQSLHNIRSMQTNKVREKAATIDDRIIMNICGDRYETNRTTLELFPDTLLGNAKRRKYYYDAERNEYFFDRHRGCFAAILYYYQSNGRLRRPDYVPLDIFLEEITFFQLGQEALNQLRKNENIKEVKKIRLPKTRWRRRIWATSEYPDYSLTAKIFNIISLLMIVIATIVMAVESLPNFASLNDMSCTRDSDVTDNTTNVTSTSTKPDVDDCHAYYSSPLFIIQAVCVGFFTIEIILRVISTPSLCDYIKNIMNWIDVAAVIPFFISLIINLTDQENAVNSNMYVGLRLLRILRLVRVFKFARVFKSVKSLRVLATTVRQSLLDFLIMIVILTLLGFLFGAAAYYAENDSNPQVYDSIFKATYWGIITITSVGFGDIAPITPIGRIIGSLCALFGAATIGMLVSVLVDRYQRVFARKLYVEEEPIDFDDYSDDESIADGIAKDSSRNSRTQSNTRIEDPDARARGNNMLIVPQISTTSDDEIVSPIRRNSSRIRFIIGYVDNPAEQTSSNAINEIGTVVQDRQTADENITLNIISNDDQTDLSPDVDDDSNDSKGEILTGINEVSTKY